MTQNLRIQNYKLTPSDSDVSDSRFALPASNLSQSSFDDDYNTAFVYIDSNQSYGGYYSWYASATTPVKIEAKKLSMYVGLQRLSVEKLIAHRNLTT